MRHGCLVVALGSPQEPTPAAIRRFLKPFLSDQRVVDFHPAAWLPILHGMVLPARPGKIREQYEAVWTDSGSPLTVHTLAQRDHLQDALPDVDVRYAMTYTAPSIETALTDWDVDAVTVIPLFPQYAPSTVAAVMDQVTAFYRASAWMPHLHLVQSWPDTPRYVNWHARQLARTLTAQEQSDQGADKVVFSYHGVPERAVHAPGPYRAQCETTTAAIVSATQELVGHEIAHESTFQSKFGPGAWLAPATIDRMGQLPAEGVHNVVMLTPGFVADCIETSYELDVLNRDEFLAAGGSSFTRVAPPNSDPEVGLMLAEVFHRAHRLDE